MRWRQGRRSENVEDRRGERRASGAGVRIGGGLGGIVVLLLAFVLLGPEQAMNLLQQNGGAGVGVGDGPAPAATAPNPQEDQLVDFVSVVLGTTEDVWHEQFQRLGRQYREPKLVIFRNAVESACGTANSAVGPFYCPGDETLYIDLSFYDELKNRFGAPGDFAQAYVIAHEVGHHVQKLLGATDYVHSMKGRVSEVEYNQYSVRLELQADFYAGVWAHHADRAQQILENGDVAEALGAASAIGDDKLQKQARGYVTPDSFTHGSSAQRVRWFKLGLQTGDIEQGDTFNAAAL
ncbi:MAG: neutral zinc metallopeptidase [Planctomycetaceae bacterium]|nr:neutral zinc metallopeptidase [Planctomycetales bacterium]MCB9875260.1 neutral zinc metallopeptidase [Planctomycetaceae bacterium]MCB9937927.1 neutral zinc metallopeptidase [Planctomycetaceae bacterium]HRX78163.1 neutral zinc metallopeptidase [Pirellulaceae bacterium]